MAPTPLEQIQEATRETCTAEELAHAARVSTSTIHRWAKNGQIRAVKLSPGRTRFDPRSLLERYQRPHPGK